MASKMPPVLLHLVWLLAGMSLAQEDIDVCTHIKNRLGAETCVDTLESGFKGFRLSGTVENPLKYAGLGFDDNIAGGATPGAMNVCMLAAFGNGGVVPDACVPTSGTEAAEWNGRPGLHYFGMLGFPCGFNFRAFEEGETLDWTFPTGNTCIGDVDLDVGLTSLVCMFDMACELGTTTTTTATGFAITSTSTSTLSLTSSSTATPTTRTTSISTATTPPGSTAMSTRATSTTTSSAAFSTTAIPVMLTTTPGTSSTVTLTDGVPVLLTTTLTPSSTVTLTDSSTVAFTVTGTTATVTSSVTTTSTTTSMAVAQTSNTSTTTSVASLETSVSTTMTSTIRTTTLTSTTELLVSPTSSSQSSSTMTATGSDDNAPVVPNSADLTYCQGLPHGSACDVRCLDGFARADGADLAFCQDGRWRVQGECLKEDAEVVQSAAVQVVLEANNYSSSLLWAQAHEDELYWAFARTLSVHPSELRLELLPEAIAFAVRLTELLSALDMDSAAQKLNSLDGAQAIAFAVRLTELLSALDMDSAAQKLNSLDGAQEMEVFGGALAEELPGYGESGNISAIATVASDGALVENFLCVATIDRYVLTAPSWRVEWDDSACASCSGGQSVGQAGWSLREVGTSSARAAVGRYMSRVEPDEPPALFFPQECERVLTERTDLVDRSKSRKSSGDFSDVEPGLLQHISTMQTVGTTKSEEESDMAKRIFVQRDTTDVPPSFQLQKENDKTMLQNRAYEVLIRRAPLFSESPTYPKERGPGWQRFIHCRVRWPRSVSLPGGQHSRKVCGRRRFRPALPTPPRRCGSVSPRRPQQSRCLR
ncbi:hypothetical protein AK812_SmicGene880 [Symbiodinium microadriaticum]|uniref:Uncharacterized protein n=1 Tax=Symbiodinium microadriaticum TaxID=2951 RepID=A0A1Q9F5K4_SYMMI|nr:hypothetical protein AK812_SmicGene880 [Symbiodinium microadriaticum]